MKHTTLENPEILVKDPRILELDRIVTEVKEDEEWEAVHMNFMEICIEKGKTEGRAEGRMEGRAESILELLEDYGIIPEKVRETVFAEKDSEVLKKWLKLATHVTSIEEFLAKM